MTIEHRQAARIGFLDDFGTWSVVALEPHMNPQNECDKRNKKLDDLSLEHLGKWFVYTPDLVRAVQSMQ
jgi:hypothetical protein